MTTIEQLEQRVAAIENTVTDGDVEFEEVSDITELVKEVQNMSERLETLERRLVEIEGATQSLEGYLGNVRSVNQETEDRADAAIAAVDRLEQKIETFERQVSVEAFEALAQRVEELEQDQQRLAKESRQESGTASEFVFGSPTEGEVDTEQPVAEEPPGTESANSGATIDPAAKNHDRHENSHAAERLPPQQQRVNETYGSESSTEETQREEDDQNEEGTFENLLAFDNGMPKWLKK